MKKIYAMLLLITMMMVSAAMAMAQTAIDSTSVSPGGSSSSIVSLISNYKLMFATFGSMVAGILIIVEFLKKLIGKSTHTPNIIVQAISWATGLLVTMIGWKLQLGFLQGMGVASALMYGLASTLAANGIGSTKVLSGIINLVAPIFLKLFPSLKKK